MTRTALVGIDPGVKTGLALYDTQLKKLVFVETVKVYQAFQRIQEFIAWSSTISGRAERVIIVLEDARLAGGPPDRVQGAGWIRTLSGVYEDFLRDLKKQHPHIEIQLKAPAPSILNWPASTFKHVTKYTGRTSAHSRDAAMLVFGRTC